MCKKKNHFIFKVLYIYFVYNFILMKKKTYPVFFFFYIHYSGVFSSFCLTLYPILSTSSTYLYSSEWPIMTMDAWLVYYKIGS